MSVSNRLPARLVGLGLLCAFCAVALYGKVREAERGRLFGRFNETQITERAHAVRSSLLTQTEPLFMTIMQCYRENRSGIKHPFWYVDYANEKGDSVIRLGFDGISGDLHYTSLFPVENSTSLPQFARPGRLTSASTVLKLSRDWVFAMNLAPKMGPWNVTRPPKKSGVVWHVAWQCRDHTLNFSFDQKTGRLIMAQVRV